MQAVGQVAKKFCRWKLLVNLKCFLEPGDSLGCKLPMIPKKPKHRVHQGTATIGIYSQGDKGTFFHRLMGKQGKRFVSGSIPGCCRTSSEWEDPRSLAPRLQARGSRRFSGAPGKVDCYKRHFNKSWSKCHCSKNN